MADAVKEKQVDTELIFAYAETGILAGGNFISTPEADADIQSVEVVVGTDEDVCLIW